MLMLITLLNDGALISIGYDNVAFSPVPLCSSHNRPPLPSALLLDLHLSFGLARTSIHCPAATESAAGTPMQQWPSMYAHHSITGPEIP